MPLKVVNSSGGISFWDGAQAITYATDHGAKVVNMSWGGGGSDSTIQAAINYGFSRGLVLVAAAGNSGNLGVLYPAASDNVIAVGATQSDDARWTGSSYGPQLDVMAPGVGIYSANLAGSYSNFGGTSFASPHVAALAALIMSANPGLTNQQVVGIITSTALDLGDLGWDQYYGYGRIQADKALQKATGTTPQPSPTPSPIPTPAPTPAPTDTTAPTTIYTGTVN